MRYRVFMMLIANAAAAQAATARDHVAAGPEKRARALQIEPRRLYLESHLLPFVADVQIARAVILPPSERIAVHLDLFRENDPGVSDRMQLHVRANTLWPVARIRASSGDVTHVSLLADRRGRVKTEYRNERTHESQLIAGQHGVTLDRAENTQRGMELHGRAWHVAGGTRAFSALVRRADVGYTFDLGKVGGHYLRLDVKGPLLTGLSAVSEG
jgi:hypothetical protein